MKGKWLFVLIFLFIGILSFADVVDKYVDANIVGGNHTGADWTNAWANLSDAAAEKVDLVTATDRWIIHCRATAETADTEVCLWDAWTCNSSYYVTVQVDEADRHDGKWTSTKYRLELSPSSDNGFTINECKFMHIIGLQFYLNTSNEYKNLIDINSTQASDVTKIEKCIFRGNNAGDTYGINVEANGSGSEVQIWNCSFQDFYHASSDAAGIKCAAETVIAHNCTAYHNRWGYTQSGGTFTAVNCGSDSHAVGFNGTIGQTTCKTTSPSFVSTSGTYDLHLQSGDTAWKDQGTDVSSGAIGFPDDIDGDTRSGNWDVGADEVTGAAEWTAHKHVTLGFSMIFAVFGLALNIFLLVCLYYLSKRLGRLERRISFFENGDNFEAWYELHKYLE